MTLLQEKPDQIEKESERTETQLDQDTSLTPSIVKEEITVVKGVGPRTKEILQNAGIFSIIQLAQSSATKLIQIGIGEATAKKIVAGAKEHIHKKNLDAYAQFAETLDDNNPENEPLILKDDPFFNSEIEQIEDDDNTNSNSDALDRNLNSSPDLKSEAWFDGKFNYSRLTGSSNLERELKDDVEINSSGSIDSSFEYQEFNDEESQDDVVDFQKNEIEISQNLDTTLEAEKSALNYNLITNSEIKIAFKTAENLFKTYEEEDDASPILVQYNKGLEMFLDENVASFLNHLVEKYKREGIRKTNTSLEFQKNFWPLVIDKSISPVSWQIILDQIENKKLPEDVREFNQCLKSNLSIKIRKIIVLTCNIIASKSKRNEKTHKKLCKIEELRTIREEAIPLLNQLINIFYNNISQESIEYEPVDATEISRFQPDRQLKEPRPLQEMNSFQNINSAIEKLNRKVKSAEYFVIEKDHKLRPLFVGIDTIALKLIRVKEFLDIICIVPIIMSKMEGAFTISENVIDYTPIHENEGRLQSKKMAQGYINTLKRAEETIFNDLTSNGELSKYIMKFLDIMVSVERTITHKTLYLHSGPLEYEVLIEPIIVCKNTVGFTEKLIPFAYMKDPNLHIVNISDLSDLLSYLDQKYFLIETYSEKKNANTLNHEAQYNFAKQIRLASIPFTIYGFTLLLIFLFQEFSLLSLLINIGYGLIGLYTVVISYIYLRLSHQKTQIRQKFAIPYHKRDLGLNNAKMRLIKEQLPLKLMEQFGYETLGKNSKSPVMEEVEQDSAQSFLTNKAMKKRVEEAKLFEEDIDNSRAKISPDAVDKYSSFLED